MTPTYSKFLLLAEFIITVYMLSLLSIRSYQLICIAKKISVNFFIRSKYNSDHAVKRAASNQSNTWSSRCEASSCLVSR